MKQYLMHMQFWRTRHLVAASPATPIAHIANGSARLASRLRLPAGSGRRFVIGLPFVWLTISFLLPFLIVFKISLLDTDVGDPFGSLVNYVDGIVHIKLKVSNYLFILQDKLYVLTYLRSLKYAAVTTLTCLVIGYPFAYLMARAKETVRPILLMLVMLPFWTSFLLRIYAWKGILANDGLLNHFLLALNFIGAPLHMMNTVFSLMIGMTYAYLPFMVLPLYANLVKLDIRYLEAAADLGATPWYTFFRVTIPLSKSGIIAGSMLVFIPCIGEYVIPELLGGPETLMIGHALWDEFFTNNDWSLASAVTVFVILLILVPMAFFNKYKSVQREDKA
jgi:putrescine transport system permease protein